MIGNDIVDLNLSRVQSNWKRKGFLEKQYTPLEQKQIFSSKHPELCLWRFWTMKEAVYKVIVQDHKQRFFDPKKLECQSISETNGSVIYQGKLYQTNTQTRANYIYTSTGESQYSFVGNGIIREQMINRIALELKLPWQSLEIRKNTLSIPELFYKQRKISDSFSISHHGKYLAFEFLLK